MAPAAWTVPARWYRRCRHAIYWKDKAFPAVWSIYIQERRCRKKEKPPIDMALINKDNSCMVEKLAFNGKISCP